jgi:DNA-binding response OmpR family regulator
LRAVLRKFRVVLRAWRDRTNLAVSTRPGSGMRPVNSGSRSGQVNKTPYPFRMVASVRVLVVEDDEAIARGLTSALGSEGYEVIVSMTAADATARLAEDSISLVLLDLSLPDGDGIDFCRRIRADRLDMPIVMLTARQGEADIVVGLDAGANDYIPKPFRLAELLARVRAQLRSVVPDETGDLVVDTAARRVFVAGSEVDLRPKEFDLLALLVANPGKVMTRERIMELVWDEHWFGSTKTLDMHVSALRKKVGETAGRITTLRHVGYRFDP